MMLKERARHVLSESDTVSLVAYLATLIQIEIAPNGVPKPINDGPRSKARRFRSISWVRSFFFLAFGFFRATRRLEGNKRRELIANLTSELPIKWHNRKQESLAGRCRAREKLSAEFEAFRRARSACVFRIYEAIIYWDFPVRNVNKREERKNWNKFKENKKKSFAAKRVNLWLCLSGSFTAGARKMGQKVRALIKAR